MAQVFDYCSPLLSSPTINLASQSEGHFHPFDMGDGLLGTGQGKGEPLKEIAFWDSVKWSTFSVLGPVRSSACLRMGWQFGVAHPALLRQA